MSLRQRPHRRTRQLRQPGVVGAGHHRLPDRGSIAPGNQGRFLRYLVCNKRLQYGRCVRNMGRARQIQLRYGQTGHIECPKLINGEQAQLSIGEFAYQCRAQCTKLHRRERAERILKQRAEHDVAHTHQRVRRQSMFLPCGQEIEDGFRARISEATHFQLIGGQTIPPE